nr:MAG TPA: hypothetical protein [Bacteriophage sp.]
MQKSKTLSITLKPIRLSLIRILEEPIRICIKKFQKN